MTQDDGLPRTDVINYVNVSTSRMVNAVVKMTALHLMNNPYMTLKDFLTMLSDDDVSILNQMFDAFSYDNNMAANILLLADMLSNAEGCPPTTEKQTMRNISYLGSVVACEGLLRKGLVEMNYSKLSFGDEMSSEIFAWLKDSKPADGDK